MEDVEDEVTFLLRLKPTPTPPIRKKINSYDTTSRKWDIIIEHHSSDVESTSSRHNSPVFSRRGLQDDQSLSPSMNRRSQQNEIYSNSRPPPLPPRWQPSAPPSEDEAHSYPKPLFEQQCSTQYVGKQDVNYLNFPPADAWMSSGYSGFPQGSSFSLKLSYKMCSENCQIIVIIKFS
ncbi:uncharacterized protein LOC123684496 [Harmonia axyridis]|uniref:uncharacterized protein LOC123684496 n=1 Tax=Harmonia axyridis TaxID=115357 RepID=UPI001E2756D8|nr:uncharacterized protein LOC123684496 [Harmonia axyridis]